MSNHADAVGFGVCDDEMEPKRCSAPDAPYDSCSYLKDSWIFVR